MALSDQVVFRILLAKTLLNRQRSKSTAEPDSFFVAQQILAAHDSAELAIAAIADHCGARSNEQYLMQYITAIEKQTSKTVEGRGYMTQLNHARVGFKHYGNLPDAKQWLRVIDKVYETVAKWCADFLDISLDDFDQSALIQLPEVRTLYANAKQRAFAGEHKEALVELGQALHLLLRENSALRGLRAGVARPEDAIKLSGFGVHGNDYLALQEFLPTISEDSKTQELKPYWKQSEFGHPANWRRDTVEFCLRTFLDTALKIQNAEWIPGAIDFDYVYEYKVTAVEAVDFWKARPARNETLDVLFSLDPGESIIASDVGAYGASGTFAALLHSKYIDWTSDGTGKKYDAHLEIKPSDLDLIADLMAHGGGGVVFVKRDGVSVRCVPRQTEFVKQHFPDLPEIDWQIKAATD